MGITHNKVATLVDEVGAEVNKAEWNDVHAISLTKAEFDTACSDGNFVFVGGALGTPSSGVATNLTGTASGLTAGNVTTIPNLTGVVTSVGNATAIADAALSIAKTSGLQVALDAKQPLDAALTALAAGSDFVQFTGPLTATKVFTLPDASSTLLFSGGALGTPASGVATNLTGTAAGLTSGSVTNATLTTGLTVNTGTVTLTGNAANTSALTIGAGAVSVSGANTGDQTITLTGNVIGTGVGSFATTIAAGVVTEAMQVLADNTTLDVSTTKHGYAPKAPNDATKFLNGAGAWAVPASTTALVYSNTTVPAGNTIANTITETAFASTYTISANTLVAGQVIRVRAYGVYGTDVIAPTLQGRVRFGGVAGTLMLDTGAVTAIAAVTNGGWSFDALFVVQTIGATGTIEAQGYAEFATAATTALSVNAENTAPITVNTTAAQAIAVTMQWGTANAANTITLRGITVEIMSVTSVAGGSSAGALTRVGGNTTEATTTSTSAVDLLTASGLSIATNVPIFCVVAHRKTAGAASATGVGLKLNATVTGEASISAPRVGNTSTVDQAEARFASFWLGPRITAYNTQGSATGLAAAATNNGTSVGSSPTTSASQPIATITDLIIRGISTASVTCGADELHVYTLSVS